MTGDELDQVRTYRANISKNATAAKASGRNIAFFLEVVAVVLLLFVMLAVMLNFFGRTLSMSQRAELEVQSVTTARQIAEVFQSADTVDDFTAALGGTADAASGTVTAHVEYIAGVPMDASVAISDETFDDATLRTARITVTSADGGSPYTLTSSRCVSGGER